MSSKRQCKRHNTFTQEENPLLAAALRYAEHGIPIFPVHHPLNGGCSCRKTNCGSVGKHPMIKGWKEKATTDLDQISEWWEKWPDANIGMPTGSKSGSIVLDIDPKHGGVDSMSEWMARYEEKKLGKTVLSMTGGGGVHALYKNNADCCVPNKVGLLEGVDIRSDGGFIVIPPSTHVSGGTYRWRNSPFDHEVAEMPIWLRDLLTTPKHNNGDRTGRVTGEQILAGLKGGERDDKTFQFLRKARRGILTQDELEAVALMIQERCDSGDHPFTKEEALKCARSAYSFEEFPGQPVENGLEIWDCDDPEPQWIIQGVLPQGCTLFAGPPKTRKTWIVLEMSLSVCLGRFCFGKFASTEQGEVLWVDPEDSRSNNKDRLRKLLDGERDSNLVNLKVQRQWPKGNRALEALEGYLEDHPQTKMVIFDTLVGIRESRSKQQDLYDYDYQTIAQFREISDRYGIAIVLVHHFNKSRDSADVFDRISGSSGVQAAPHTLMVINAKRGDRGGIIEVTGKRSKEMKFAVESASGDRPLWRDPRHFEMSRARLDIIRELAEVYPETLSRGDLADILSVKSGTMTKRLSVMVRDRQIEQIGGKNHSRYKALPSDVEVSNEAEGQLRGESDAMVESGELE
jgi:hypothetical protein